MTNIFCFSIDAFNLLRLYWYQFCRPVPVARNRQLKLDKIRNVMIKDELTFSTIGTRYLTPTTSWKSTARICMERWERSLVVLMPVLMVVVNGSRWQQSTEPVLMVTVVSTSVSNPGTNNKAMSTKDDKCIWHYIISILLPPTKRWACPLRSFDDVAILYLACLACFRQVPSTGFQVLSVFSVSKDRIGVTYNTLSP